MIWPCFFLRESKLLVQDKKTPNLLPNVGVLNKNKVLFHCFVGLTFYFFLFSFFKLLLLLLLNENGDVFGKWKLEVFSKYTMTPWSLFFSIFSFFLLHYFPFYKTLIFFKENVSINNIATKFIEL